MEKRSTVKKVVLGGIPLPSQLPTPIVPGANEPKATPAQPGQAKTTLAPPAVPVPAIKK